MAAVDERVGVVSDCGMIRSWAGGRRLGGAETCRRLLRERHENGGVLVDWRRIVGLEHDGEERGGATVERARLTFGQATGVTR